MVNEYEEWELVNNKDGAKQVNINQEDKCDVKREKRNYYEQNKEKTKRPAKEHAKGLREKNEEENKKEIKKEQEKT